MRRHHPPPITVVQRSPSKYTQYTRYCWQCHHANTLSCPTPNTPLSSKACPTFTYDPRPHCPKCHATGGTIEAVPHHKGKHTYTYYRINHYDPTKKSKRRCCYLGKTLPPGLQQKLRASVNGELQ